jgi:putative DNA-invertase from lambdoid prophage Rac
VTTYGYIRTSRALQVGVPGMDPESQVLQLRQAGVEPAHIHRDVGVSGSTGTRERQGWHRLHERLVGGDTLVVVRIDRVGRNWLDTVECMLSLRRIGVKIKSLDDSEAWTSLLEMDPSDPMAYAGHMVLSFAAWVAHQERELGRQRTREGLAKAKSQGKRLGRPPALNDRQREKARRMVEAGMSIRFVAGELEVSRDALRRALKVEEGQG